MILPAAIRQFAHYFRKSSWTKAASFALFVLVFSLVQAFADEAPLEGHVEESGKLLNGKNEIKKRPILRPLSPWQDMNQPDDKDISGGAQEDALPGEAESRQSEMASQSPQGGRFAPSPLLRGYASQGDLSGEDPDADDQELMIEWDRWRNRFLHAVQNGMQENLNNPSAGNLRWDPQAQVMTSKFPMGIEAWFSCEVTPDRHIVHAKIVHSSGNRAYDEAVLDAIDNLQGSQILRYPRGSKRAIVAQVAGIKTAPTSQYQYFRFGDVERQIIPGQ